jgi:hypothetical protein
MSIPGAVQQISPVTSLLVGVEAHTRRFGGTEYRVGRRELGHIHGDALVEITFPARVRDKVIAFGKAQPILPVAGRVSLHLRQPPIELLEKSYALVLEQ